MQPDRRADACLQAEPQQVFVQALLHAALREAAAASTRAEELASAGAAAIIASSPCASSS